VEKGYINSGAVIPAQDVADGVLEVKIVEGQLTDVEVEGNKWFRAGYMGDRIGLGAGPPLNIVSLQERLQMLQQDQRIERINAELKPGGKPGESILNVRSEERRPYRFWLGFDNYESPTVGGERGWGTVAHENLTGRGDTLSLTYGRSDGIDGQIDASYSIPLTSRDTTATFRYRRNEYLNVEDLFDPLDIETESDVYEFTVRHPFYRTVNDEFAVAFSADYQEEEAFLLGERFSFSPGAEDGESKVTALRFTPEYTYRTQNQVIAVRSRFSLGIDALGATTHSDSKIPDGEFVSWLGQFQWARILGLWDTQMIFRTDIQLTPDPLLSLEQMAIGGRYSVRGYRENHMVTDNGLAASLEFRIPLVRNKPWADYLQLASFVDFGWGENKELPDPSPNDITSAGLGLRWGVTLPPPLRLKPQCELYWGIPFRDIDYTEYDLQNDGVHFQFVLSTY